MTDVLHGTEEDVPFDHGVCNDLQQLCTTTASALTTQAGSRSSAVTTGSTDFKGYFSGLFEDNARTAKADGEELAQCLRDLSSFAGQLQAAAITEQRRREKARQWKQDMDDRSGLHKAWDDFWGSGEDPPVGPPDAPQDFSPSPPRTGTRTTPTPGSGGGGGGGTSSARPENLRSFASSSETLNGELSGKPGNLRSALSRFASQCRWGTLNGDGVATGFDKWLAANDTDIEWARTVASAFARAGGEGNISTLPNSALLATLQAAGVSATRQDLTIDPPTAWGHPPTTGYSLDPVNTATGNFLEREVDLAFTGATSELIWDRTYNSFDTGAGAFGTGWSSWPEAGVELDSETARMTLPDGRVVVFPRLGDGWDRGNGENMWLGRTATGLRATTNDGTVLDFDPTGKLLEVSSGDGTAVRLLHDDGRLVRVTHARGRSVELTWSGDRVSRATASDGRAIDYSYDEQGRLVSATGPTGTRSYRWEDDLVAAVVDADGVVETENTYDSERRVAWQRTPYGREVRFVYLAGNVTVVSDPDGGRSNTWIHDARGRLIGAVDSEESRQSTSYDGHGNPVLFTERDGSVTVHEYDDRGRRTRTVEPNGGDLTYGYDEADRVTTVVAASGGVVEYSYDDPDSTDGTGSNRNPSVIVDPEGGRTELTWTAGQLTELVDPTGVRVTFAYDELGDLVETTDALGRTARLERDAAGRVVASTTPTGHRTTFTYDHGGVLASRREPDGGVWRFESTTAGRLTATIDPTGARTEVEQGSHGDPVRTIDPIGRAISRTLDDFGNLAAVELPDGSTWRYTHDALSRLVAATDPSGEQWRTEYDTNGEVAATVDPTGVRIAFSSTPEPDPAVTVADPAKSITWGFDPLGRPTSRTEADGSSTMATYDRCGRPVELLDGEGGLTRIERDAAGRVVTVTTPAGAVRHHEYDACGRRSAVVDAAGGRTSVERDPDGRVIREVLPTGEVSRIDYDPCGRIIARAVPGRGVARYRYDLAGRMVESSDTWYGHRKFRYDAAGQLVEVVNGNGGVTRYDYDTNGRPVTVTDPLGHTTHREFDAMNRCVAETDPLGRTIRAGYDAAGRQLWQLQPGGERLEWSYDEAGRLAAISVDGASVASYERDYRRRTVVVSDHTSEEPGVHELEWNRRGQLVRRTRGDRSVSWTYDADGHRTGVSTPDGHTTTYAVDAVGRVGAVDHPLLGRVVLERDVSGRLARATAGDTVQSWDYRDGFVVGHTLTSGAHTAHTSVTRDDDGRITTVDRDGASATYSYDAACQLVETRFAGSVTRWSYDPAGHLVSESVDGAVREHTYDPASQLVETREADGSATRHGYDETGRRIRTETADGRVRELDWTPAGWLSSIVDQVAGASQRTTLHVDALGELADVDGTELFWDTADSYAPDLLQLGSTPVVPAGPFTGLGSTWAAAGWRTARGQAPDPWSAEVATPGADLPDALGLGSTGELTVGAADPLEWLHARVYDPASRGFLSVDPLDPVTGAGSAGNPYAYAGNDPVHALDPTGLRAATDADLQAYQDAHNGWIKDNWEYVAGGAAMLVGGALMFTGVGGPLGGMLISAGLDTIMQKAQNGKVDWVKVGISGGLGAFSGAGLVSKIPISRFVTGRVAQGVTRATLQGTITGGGGGMVTGTYDYYRAPGPHTFGGALQNAGIEGLRGAGTGMVMGPASYGVDQMGQQMIPHFRAGRLLRNEDDLVVLGGQVDTSVAAQWDGHVSQLADEWHPNLNRAFVDDTISRGRTVYSASTGGAGDADLERLIDSGYDYQGDVWSRTP